MWILAIVVVIIAIIIIVAFVMKREDAPEHGPIVPDKPIEVSKPSLKMQNFLANANADYIEKPSEYPNYNFARGRWMQDAIIDTSHKGKPIEELVKACDSLAECRAFNSSGELISEPYLTHQIDFVPSDKNVSGSLTGIYIKNGATQKDILDDYEFKQGWTLNNGKYGIPPSGFQLKGIKKQCNDNANCRGFTSLGAYHVGNTSDLRVEPEWTSYKFLGTYLKRKG